MWKAWENLIEEEVEACFSQVEQQELTCTSKGCHAKFATVKEVKQHQRKHHPTTRKATDNDAKTIIASALDMVRKVGFFIELADPPLLTITDLLQKYFDIVDKNKFYAMYPGTMKNASSIFNIAQIQAALLLIKVFDAIANYGEEDAKTTYVPGIDGREAG